MRGYDQLARRVSRIAVYPMLLLPNTDYMEKKDEYGIISVRGDNDDFEYVLAHHTMTFAENQQMQRFLFWARVVAENAVLRHIWVALRNLAGITQSQLLLNLDSWMTQTDDPAAAFLRTAQAQAAGGTHGFGAAITYLYANASAKPLLMRWWAEAVRPLIDPAAAPVLDEIFRYDLITQPICETEPAPAADSLPTVQVRGETYYLRTGVQFGYDVPNIIDALHKGGAPNLAPTPIALDLYYRSGAANAVTSTNHEIVVHYMGMTRDQVLTAASGQVTPAGEAADGVVSLLGDRGGCG
jgi:hypothetical protein